MTSALDPATDAAVRRAWAQRLGVAPGALIAPEPVFVTRPDLAAAVVVRLGETFAVAAPEPALTRLRRLAAPQLMDVESLLGALEPLGPSLIGAASLSYVDRRTVAPSRPGVRRATAADVEDVLSRCVADESDESGVEDMSTRWVVDGEGGQPEGVAGYEIWSGELAHLGVVVAAASRGHGFGARAALAAAAEAIGAGLVPQWRCRLDNAASARLSERLGFVRLGEQVAIDLLALGDQVRG